MSSERIDSTRAPEPVGAFPHARRTGDLIFLSGIGPRVRGSKEIPGVTLGPDGEILEYDIEAQMNKIIAAGLAYNFGARLLVGI